MAKKGEKKSFGGQTQWSVKGPSSPNIYASVNPSFVVEGNRTEPWFWPMGTQGPAQILGGKRETNDAGQKMLWEKKMNKKMPCGRKQNISQNQCEVEGISTKRPCWGMGWHWKMSIGIIKSIQKIACSHFKLTFCLEMNLTLYLWGEGRKKKRPRKNFKSLVHGEKLKMLAFHV